jgi:hypothetical protein
MRVGRYLLTAILVLTPVAASAGDGTFGVPPSGILLPPPPAPLRLAPAPVAPSRSAALIPPERAAPEKVIAPQRVQQTYQPAPADGAGRSRALPPSEAPVHSPVIAPPKHKRFKAPAASVDPEYIESVAQGEPRSLSAPAPEPAPVVAQGAAPEQKRGLFGMLRGRSAQQPQAQVRQGPAAPVQLTPAAYAAPSNSAASAAYAEYAAMPVQRNAAVAAPAPIQAVAAPQAPVQPVVAPVQPVAAGAPMQQMAAPAPAKSRLSSLFSSLGGGSTSKAKPGARANDGTPCSEKRGLFTSPPECR